MFLEKIELVNFRNHDKKKIKFSNKINILYGSNGIGKTAIIEAIYFVANLKSHRTNFNINLIKKEKAASIINCQFKKKELTKEIKITFDKDGKKIEVDGDKVIKKEIRDSFNTIIFEPGDLELIKGDPHYRRTYIDNQLSKISKQYYKINKDYEKIIKQRNNLLKQYQFGKENNKLLEVLNEELVNKGAWIIKIRKQYFDNINLNIGSLFFDLAELKGLTIKYINKVQINEYEIIKEKLKKEIEKVKEEEKEKGITLIGPHRDDFGFWLRNNNLKTFGSQGQQRLAVIALKLSEIPIFYKLKNEFPLLLLDDIFSELDIIRKNKLLKYISDEMQVIITTTDLANIQKELINKAITLNLDEVENE